MTGSEVKIENIYPWIDSLTNPDFNPDWKNEKIYWYWRKIEINLFADSTNVSEMFISENSWDPSSKRVWLRPWQWLVLDYSDTKAMNIFYATGSAGDVLFVICR